MSGRINLKELERKAFLSYHQDGLLDLFLGTALLSMSVFMSGFLPINVAFLWSATLYIWVVSYAGAKKVITVPRIGYVEFSARRRVRLTAIWLAFAVVGLVFGLVIAFDVTVTEVLMPILVSNGLLLIGLFGGSIFVVLGLASSIRRFHCYGGLTLVAFALSKFFAMAIFWPTVILGIVTTVTGAVLLVRFVRKYPKEQVGDMGDVGSREG